MSSGDTRYAPSDFFGSLADIPQPRKTPAQMLATIEQLNVLLGGRDERAARREFESVSDQ